MTQTPANWYDDGSGRLRYWDGSAWTDHFADTYVPPLPPAPSAPEAGFGPAQSTANWDYQPQATAQGDGFPANYDHAAPPTTDERADLGYAVPGAGGQDALADPFAAAPRQDSYPTSASAPKKKLPGWALALIVTGIVLIVGAAVAIAFLFVNVANTTNNVFEDAVKELDNATTVPTELESTYWELDDAYRNDSCSELMAVTTQSYRDSVGIENDTCAGAFNLDEDAASFYAYVESGEITGDSATLVAYESYSDAGQDFGDDASYTLVNVEGAWLFDTIEFD